MWYVPRHRRSFWKAHAQTIGMTIGLAAFFALPLIIWALGLA